MPATRHYLHGDYLEASDRRPGSVVYCAFCDGFCLPEHLYDEHELEQNIARLNASKKSLDRARQESNAPSTPPTTSTAHRIPSRASSFAAERRYFSRIANLRVA